MTRISSTFSALKAANKKALIPFVMAGDPDVETSFQLIDTIIQNGADVIEIGMPFSDPMADGPIIDAAGQRALAKGVKLTDVLALAKRVRAAHAGTPIILMGYINPILQFGLERFAKNAAASGVDGLIIVDLPPEEDDALRGALRAEGISFIRLIAPTSLGERLATLLSHTDGFVYYISVAGITGQKSADAGALAKQLQELRSYTDLPIAVGFGIKTPEQAKAASGQADAVVVGSALVALIAEHGTQAKTHVAEFIRALKAAV